MNEKMYVDDLTGLKNRRYYNEQKALLENAIRQKVKKDCIVIMNASQEGICYEDAR